jgi:hypothetical protein
MPARPPVAQSTETQEQEYEMADDASFLRWARCMRGREEKVVEVFNELIEYYASNRRRPQRKTCSDGGWMRPAGQDVVAGENLQVSQWEPTEGVPGEGLRHAPVKKGVRRPQPEHER